MRIGHTSLYAFGINWCYVNLKTKCWDLCRIVSLRSSELKTLFLYLILGRMQNPFQHHSTKNRQCYTYLCQMHVRFGLPHSHKKRPLKGSASNLTVCQKKNCSYVHTYNVLVTVKKKNGKQLAKKDARKAEDRKQMRDFANTEYKIINSHFLAAMLHKPLVIYQAWRERTAWWIICLPGQMAKIAG